MIFVVYSIIKSKEIIMDNRKKSNSKATKILRTILLLSIFTGCDKNIDDEEVHLVESINVSIGASWFNYWYEYDSQNRFKKILYEESYGYNQSVTYTYSGNNLDKVEKEGPFYIQDGNNNYIKLILITEFSKSGNQINVKETDNFGQVYYYGIIYLNKDGFPNKYEERGTDYSQVFTFQIQNGNLTKITHTFAGSTRNREYYYIYEYDNMKSPFYHCKTPKWYLFLCVAYNLDYYNFNHWFNRFEHGSRNNVILEERYENNDVYKNEIEYEYTTTGFPRNSGKEFRLTYK